MKIIFSQTNPPPELKDLLSHTLNRISKARKHLLGHKVTEQSKDGDQHNAAIGNNF